MTAKTTPAQVRAAWITRSEIALIDLREEDPFAKDHPLFAVQIPLSRLELEILDKVPRKAAPIVLYDNGEGRTSRAAHVLSSLGYTDVSELDGGLEGWRKAGYELFQDVNSCSKAFGELVEHCRHTPSLPAPEAKALIESEFDLVVLDARRYDEFQTMSIPRGMSVPGAELVLRAREIAPDPTTTIIVNCAGRTRSIIGAQSLINAGVPNPVFALRNGSIGWKLAGQALDHGKAARFPNVTPKHVTEAKAKARAVSYRAGVRRLDPAILASLVQDDTRTLYRFDVRTQEEYASGHIPGFKSSPGGQLVQETDMNAAVRGARIVLADDVGPRADMSASWLAQMNWEVYVLDGGFDGKLETGTWTPSYPTLPDAQTINVAEMETADLTVVDLATSPQYRKGHIPGAWFVVRARLAQALNKLPLDKDFVLTSPDGALARLAAADLAALTGHKVWVLQGGTAAWAATGRSLVTGLTDAASDPDDIYRRPYEGTDNTATAMQAYLDWEFGLVDQLARDGTHGFFVI